MLKTMGYGRFSDLIKEAIFNVYREGRYLTVDVGGNSGTKEFTRRVIQEIEYLDTNGIV